MELSVRKPADDLCADVAGCKVSWGFREAEDEGGLCQGQKDSERSGRFGLELGERMSPGAGVKISLGTWQ